MQNCRAVVRVVVLSSPTLTASGHHWRDRIAQEISGVSVTHLALDAAMSGTATAMSGLGLDVEVALLLIDGSTQELNRALDAAMHAMQHSAGESGGLGAARVIAVSDAVATVCSRAGFELMPRANADSEILPFLRGIVACASNLREARRELSLLNRVVGSMRNELEERTEELQLAAQVQRDFLPLPIEPVHGVRVSTFYRPLALVSGDVYHIEQVDDDQISIFLADAVGHGIPAALLGTAVCRSLEVTERVHGVMRVLGPAETLARANRRLIEHQRATTRFATAIAGLLDCRTRRLRLAVAGHPPAILLRPGQLPQQIEASGGLLGIFPDEEYSEVEIDLQPNDRLLLYSDGFEQAFFEDGASRHIEEFGKLAGVLDCEQLVNEIAARIDAQSGSLHQADDLTLLCISVEEIVAMRRAA